MWQRVAKHVHAGELNESMTRHGDNGEEGSDLVEEDEDEEEEEDDEEDDVSASSAEEGVDDDDDEEHLSNSLQHLQVSVDHVDMNDSISSEANESDQHDPQLFNLHQRLR
jgi:DNA-directed RNA polymerase subunit delta